VQTASESNLVVDLGDNAVRLLEGIVSAEGVRLTTHAELPLPADVDLADERERGALAERLRAILEERFGGRDATIVLTEGLAMLRTLTLPASTQANLRSIVELRVETEVPLPGDGAAWDFTAAVESDGDISVLLAVARTDDVLARLRLLKEAGIRPQSVRVGLLALCAAYSRSDACVDGEDVCLLDVRGDVAAAVFLQRGRPVWHRELLVGNGNLARELGQCTRYYSTEFDRPTIGRLVLLGHLPQPLPAALGMEVVDRPTISAVTFEPGADGLDVHGDWTAAIGAMFHQLDAGGKAMDLLPSLVASEKPEVRDHNPAHTVAAVAAAVVLCLALVANSLWIKRSRLHSVRQALTDLKATQREALSLEKELAFLTKLEKEKTPWLDVLKELSELAPPGVTLRSMLLQKKGTVDLTGVATDYQSVSVFAEKLKASTWFHDAKPTNMHKPKREIEFRITCRIRTPRRKPK